MFNTFHSRSGEGEKREIKYVVFGEENEVNELKIGFICRCSRSLMRILSDREDTYDFRPWAGRRPSRPLMENASDREEVIEMRQNLKF